MQQQRRHDFITMLITRDHGNWGCFQQVGKLWELCQSHLALPSSAPSAAMYFYFNILTPQGPAQSCAHKIPSILRLQMFVPNRGSQAGQNTAGRNVLNRKGDPIQTGCLMCVFLSVNIPQQRANSYGNACS